MLDNATIVSVAAGLVVGIALIVIFASVYRPMSPLGDDTIIAKTMAVKEVQFFMQKYPQAKISVDRLERGAEVTYAAEKPVTNPDASQDGISEKRLIASVDPFGASEGVALRLECYHARGMNFVTFDGVTESDIDNSCF